VAKKGSYVTANYVGVACSTGQQFDSSWDNGQPFSVTVGQGTIQGFGDGLIGVKAGMQRQIEIPAAQAYGAAGSAPKIGPNDPLVFIVDIVDVAAKAPSASTTTAPKATTTTAPKATTTTAATTTTGG
jgi:peptidylprolyl isomerase